MTHYEKALALWQAKAVTTEAALAEALNALSVALAYHSGRIENENITYHDTREIFEHDSVTAYTGDLRTLFEIRNSKEAYELFLTAFGQKRPLDEGLIKEFQFALTQHTYDSRRWNQGERPGQYKRHDYVTGLAEVGAAPEDVQEELAELLAELAAVAPPKALIAAAYFHAKFEHIHPFADGNGRTGRLTMNYFLVSQGHPPIVIHQEDRQSYYDALNAWDREQSLEPLIDFLKAQTEKTWRNQLEKASLSRKNSGPSLRDFI